VNILIVDDETVQIETITRGLRSRGFRVIHALNADEALGKLNDPANGIDMVITDYAMPGMNGIGLLKKIRVTHRNLPVIMMTAYGEKEIVIDALRNRCDSFIEKPFSLDHLLREAQRAMDNARQAGQDAAADIIPRHLHQINNPLMSIIGSAELAMLQINDSETVKRSIQRILDSARKITKINQEIMKKGIQNTEMTGEVDIGTLLDNCLGMFTDLLDLRKVVVDRDYGHRGAKVCGPRFSLEQLFKNLILNAIEAMEAGPERRLRMETHFETYSSTVVVNVSDSGCGIPESALGTLFVPYLTSKPHGTGLGLPVVKNIAEKCSGSVSVKSHAGKGTTFTVRLPADRHAVKLDKPVEAHRQPHPVGSIVHFS